MVEKLQKIAQGKLLNILKKGTLSNGSGMTSSQQSEKDSKQRSNSENGLSSFESKSIIGLDESLKLN